MKTEDYFQEIAENTIKNYMKKCNNMTTEENINSITALIYSALKELELYTNKEKVLDLL